MFIINSAKFGWIMQSSSQKNDGENAFPIKIICNLSPPMAVILNFLSAHLLSTLIGTYAPSFIPIPSSVLEKTFLKDWPIRNFKVLWRQCLWRISTKETILVRELIGNITASLVSCSVFFKKKFEVWNIHTDDRHQVMAKAHTGPFARWVKMKTTLANFLGQIISNFIRVRIFIFTRFGGQNIYFLCIVVRNPDKHNIYFIFSWRGQI